tara:strand:+ start:5702 stop:6172 length:471 start_codon:yes stop_codon:yes gene_type:complete
MNVLNFEEWKMLEKLDDSKFYTYIIHKGNKSKPEYCGAGTADRTKVSLSVFRKEHGKNAQLEIISSHATKEAAMKKEVQLTKKYGIKSEGGKLRNERIGLEPSDELKKKHSEGLKGMKKSKDHKDNISKTLSKTTKSKEHAEAISAAMKGNKNAKK